MAYLVVVQGLPGAGKGHISRYLESEGFVRREVEAYAKRLLGNDGFIGKLRKQGAGWWGALWSGLVAPETREMLNIGSFILDGPHGITKFPNARDRVEHYFAQFTDIPRYAVTAEADDEIRYKRIVKRAREQGVVMTVEQARLWDDAFNDELLGVPYKNAINIACENNSEEDFEKTKRFLKSILV